MVMTVFMYEVVLLEPEAMLLSRFLSMLDIIVFRNVKVTITIAINIVAHLYCFRQYRRISLSFPCSRR